MKNIVSASLFSVVCLVFSAPAAASGGVAYVSFERVVRQSDTIVEVRRATPFIRTTKLQIKGRGCRGQKVPPFVKTVYRLRVLRVFKKRPRVKLPRVIEVASGNWRTLYGQHRSYHLRCLRRIPIYRQYKSPVGGIYHLQKPGRRAIVFLRKDGRKDYQLVVGGAVERVSKKGAIKRLIRRRP